MPRRFATAAAIVRSSSTRVGRLRGASRAWLTSPPSSCRCWWRSSGFRDGPAVMPRRTGDNGPRGHPARLLVEREHDGLTDARRAQNGTRRGCSRSLASAQTSVRTASSTLG
jgi:hypothetical protein